MKFNLKLFVLVGVLAGFRDVYGTDEVKNKDDDFIVDGLKNTKEAKEVKDAMKGMRVIKAVYQTGLGGDVDLIDKDFQKKLFKVLLWNGQKVEDVEAEKLGKRGGNLVYYMSEKVEYTVYFIFKENSVVESINNMFFECENLIRADFRFFNTTNVTDMSYMFYKCSALTELNLSTFDTTSVTDMVSMFSCCTALTELNLNNFKTTSVQNMSNMFYRCTSLTELDLSNFSFLNNVGQYGMFSWCSSLKTLTVKSGQVIVRSKCMGCCQRVYINNDDIQALRSCNVTLV